MIIPSAPLGPAVGQTGCGGRVLVDSLTLVCRPFHLCEAMARSSMWLAALAAAAALLAAARPAAALKAEKGESGVPRGGELRKPSRWGHDCSPATCHMYTAAPLKLTCNLHAHPYSVHAAAMQHPCFSAAPLNTVHPCGTLQTCIEPVHPCFSAYLCNTSEPVHPRDTPASCTIPEPLHPCNTPDSLHHPQIHASLRHPASHVRPCNTHASVQHPQTNAPLRHPCSKEASALPPTPCTPAVPLFLCGTPSNVHPCGALRPCSALAPTAPLQYPRNRASPLCPAGLRPTFSLSVTISNGNLPIQSWRLPLAACFPRRPCGLPQELSRPCCGCCDHNHHNLCHQTVWQSPSRSKRPLTRLSPLVRLPCLPLGFTNLSPVRGCLCGYFRRQP